MEDKKLHIAMYPWFAMGHLTSYLHISNKLAERGHNISFILPTNTQTKFEPFNLHKHLITFIPITVPCVDGLPSGTETTTDVPFPLYPLLMTAMDLTEPAIEAIVRDIKPNIVFFDFTYWLPSLARKLGIKSIAFVTVSPATVGYLLSPERKLRDKFLTEADLLQPPQGFPPSKIKLRAHEARGLAAATVKDFGGLSFMERLLLCLTECDAIGFKTCREIEGAYCDCVESQFEKRVILAGPVLPEPPASVLEEEFETLFSSFKAKSLIFCALGSECVLKKDQFQELVLGFELTGLPFFAALKPPTGHDTIESALPEGFEERVKGRGFVHGGWVQQQLILKHPSVGCFVTHCGSGSLSEAMVNECQLVLLPNVGDQIINSRLMGEDLKVGVEVERGDEDGLFTRDGVCKAVKAVMDDDSEVGKDARQNHAKLREFLISPGLENSYVDGFVQELHSLADLM
ncbi:UDP-glycosyltransferase 79B6 [Citrus sinensis]|uniref:UDP-glycosyltransferase 79B6 n=1 Tax=Citrus sinensis TaxID=2711 RepID=A0ACB8NH08_CITSI|nr:UDP-glycosyltransferase 79B6 [Citrus sinensis]